MVYAISYTHEKIKIYKQLLDSCRKLRVAKPVVSQQILKTLFENFTKIYDGFFIICPSMSEKAKFTWARIICPASSFSHWHFERQHLELEFVLTLHEDVNLDWDASSGFS